MSYWQDPIKIGNLLFPRFMGGPLDGITDSPFRMLVREFSKDELLYTEMRHVGCIAQDNNHLKTLQFNQIERPLNYQVAANATTFIEQACQKILAAGVDAIDLNIGCPARNVVCSGSGSALMADPARLKAILSVFRKELSIPFTLKMRAGFKVKNAVDIALLAQDCGVDAIALHPRLQSQHFTGQPDYAYAAQVKRAISIPLILSGNVVNFKTAQMAYEQTGADAYLIGRGIWSRPWKLHEMALHSQGQPFMVSTKTVLHYAIKHLQGMIAYYGPRGLFAFRKHLPFYLRGIPNASQLRERLVRSTCQQEIEQTLVSLQE